MRSAPLELYLQIEIAEMPVSLTQRAVQGQCARTPASEASGLRALCFRV